MELNTTRDTIRRYTTYTLVIKESEMIPAVFTAHDRQILKVCNKSDKISDGVLALAIICRRIEEAKK